MIDIANQLAAIYREVSERPGDTGEDVAVLIRRSYDAEIEDISDPSPTPTG